MVVYRYFAPIRTTEEEPPPTGHGASDHAQDKRDTRPVSASAEDLHLAKKHRGSDDSSGCDNSEECSRKEEPDPPGEMEDLFDLKLLKESLAPVQLFEDFEEHRVRNTHNLTNIRGMKLCVHRCGA